MVSQEEFEACRYMQLQADVTVYEATGVISDHMVTYFDQSGDLLHEHCFPSKSHPHTQKVLKNVCIPQNRLFSTNESGEVILHASCCISRRRRPSQINVHRIFGDLRALDTGLVVAPSLVEISGILDATGGEIDLPALRHVGFLAHAETSTTFDPDSGWRRELTLPELVTAGTITPDVHFLNLPRLETVSGDFDGNRSKRINAPRLRNVGGALSIHHSEVNFPEDIKARSLYMSPDSLRQWKEWLHREKLQTAIRAALEAQNLEI